MAILHVLHLVLMVFSMTVFQLSKSEVLVSSKKQLLSPSRGLNMGCVVQNESFVGWFKVDDVSSVKIPVVKSKADLKDKPAVVIATDSALLSKTCTLIFPRGVDLKSAGGKYVCKGEMNQDTALVYVKPNIESIQPRQSLHLGTFGRIILGAFSYPLPRFQWRKDNVDMNDKEEFYRFIIGRDGSIDIHDIKRSDAGIYNVKIEWENRVVKDVQIKVTVIETEVTILKGKNHTYFPYRRLSIVCFVPNGGFVGWFKVDGTRNIKIPASRSRPNRNSNVPGLLVETEPNFKTYHLLVFPRGVDLSPSAGGKYVCKGKVDQDTAFVSVKSDSEVYVPRPIRVLFPSSGLTMVCYIRKEQLIGWFKADSNIRIPVVQTKANVQDKPAVVIATVSNTTTKAFLVFPRGSSPSNAGIYVCKGEFHQARVKVIATKFKATSVSMFEAMLSKNPTYSHN